MSWNDNITRKDNIDINADKVFENKTKEDEPKPKEYPVYNPKEHEEKETEEIKKEFIRKINVKRTSDYEPYEPTYHGGFGKILIGLIAIGIVVVTGVIVVKQVVDTLELESTSVNATMSEALNFTSSFPFSIIILFSVLLMILFLANSFKKAFI